MSSEDLKTPGGLRKRIAGAVTLVALIVIFLPLFLQHIPQDAYLSKLPKQPDSAAVHAVTTADFNSPSPNAMPAVNNVWALQLGSFIEAGNANQLVKSLQKQRYPAYMRQVVEDGKISYKVFIGPETDRNKVQAWQDALKKKAVNGTIMPYEVSK